MKTKYIIMADGKSPHTLKWVSKLCENFNLFLITLNGYDKQLLAYIDKKQIFVVNENVNISGGNFKLLLKYFEIKKIVEKIQPNYLNAHYISSYGVLAALVKKKMPKIKLIQSAWGSDVLVSPFENIMKKKIAKFALQNADLITSDSYYMSDKIIEISGNKKIETFAFGLEEVDLDEDIQKDKNLIFSNRALSENYNISMIIEWFATLINKDVKLVIANDGEEREALEDLSKELGVFENITFVGFLTKDEQDGLYKKAQYYISIPSSDSTAVSLLEAMSFGCYPIVSNLPANREWILDGCNGSFFTENMPLPEVGIDVCKINKNIINKKAIFSKSIKNYIKRLENI
jgi:glycosyltransferase involved in cell wall biosynthesis